MGNRNAEAGRVAHRAKSTAHSVAEDRCQITEDRGQKTEARGRIKDDRIQVFRRGPGVRGWNSENRMR